MFDMNKVASNIKEARTRMNMTQMNLADEMGVSYQAVSNWERGNSMPDISKLPELCKILNISFEELVGEKTVETEIAQKLMQDDDADVSLEDMAKVGQLVKPEKIEVKVNETIEKEGKITFSTLVGLAPFMDGETLDKLAEEIADVDLKKLCAIAPFLSKQTMDRIIDKGIQNGNLDTKNVVSVAPFLAQTTIQKVVNYMISHGQSNHLVAIAPFMGKGMFPSSLSDIHISEGTVSVNINTSAKANESNNSSSSFGVDLDDLDEDEVAQLAFRAFKQGEDVEKYLDYMDEDDVAQLASMALKSGKDIAIYLDYMDEDDVKDLLLQATRK